MRNRCDCLRPYSEQHHRLSYKNTVILGHIKKSLKLQCFSIVHHPSYCLNMSNDFRTGPLSMTQRAGMRMGCNHIPVLVNVCPLYDAQRRSSSSNVSSSRTSSSVLRSTLSRKFFHSSSGFKHFRETEVSHDGNQKKKEIRMICQFKKNVRQRRKNLGKFFASRKG